MSKTTDKYEHMNHFHELDDSHELVDYGDGEFIANKQAIPLLKALNELGLKTRTHHFDDTGNGFISVLLDGVSIEVREVYERSSTRTKYNGKHELLISWKTK